MILEQFAEFLGQRAQAIFPHLGNEFKEHERDLFESSYATRLNRNMGLYFGLRS